MNMDDWDVVEHMLIADRKRTIDIDYMKNQPIITPHIRRIVVDWILQVGYHYKFEKETIHLCVMYIDRYLSKNTITKERIQLLATACLLIASKFVEVNHPNVDELIDITDNSYSREELVKMEKNVLDSMSYRLRQWSTCNAFLQILLNLEDNPLLEQPAMMLTDLVLQDYNLMMEYPPSLQAASAIYLAKVILNAQSVKSEKNWAPSLYLFNQATCTEAYRCIENLHIVLMTSFSVETQSVWDHYGQDSQLKHASSLLSQSNISTNVESMDVLPFI